MTPIALAGLVAAALALTACDPIERLMGNSPEREAAEWRDSVITPAVLTTLDTTPPAPTVLPDIVVTAPDVPMEPVVLPTPEPITADPTPLPVQPVICARDLHGVLVCL